MEKNDKEKSEGEDSSTKQVLEYYQKYSQNDEPSARKRDIIYPTRDVTTIPPKQYEKPEPNPEMLSPTESVASNKKLEWDNLGDIGYNNAKRLHKTASLPILTQHPIIKIDDIPKSPTDNVKIVIYPYTSSSEDKTSEKNTVQSSSSSPFMEKEIPSSSGTTSFHSSEKQKLLSSDSDSSLNNSKILEFKKSLNYIKKKIGLPDAHSTPHETGSPNIECQVINETPLVKKTDKPIKNILRDIQIENENVKSNMLMKPTNSGITFPANSNKKNVNLCLTKPILVDCLPKTNKKQYAVGVQTGSSVVDCKSPPEPIELITFYKEPDNNKTSDSGKSSSSNGVASKCDSFEYVKSSNNGQNISMRSESNPIEIAEGHITDNNKENSNNSENSEAATNNQELETHCTKSDDIEKHIYVLQRLIRSKKYDSSAKRKYIRKILQKITESKYLEDSSTSSDLFYPKTDPSKILHDQIKNSSFKNENTSSSYQSHEDKKVSPKKKASESTDSDISHEREQKIEIKPSTSKSATFGYRKESKLAPKKKLDSTNLLSKPSIQSEVPVSKRTKRTPFTVTREPNDTDKSSSPQSHQNWKECKTVSEKMFENSRQVIGAGDQVTQFADKERQYQLNWIDREINHLGKLKSILEKHKEPYPLPENLKKMTHVYMVTADNNDAVHRNYVIETKLGTGTSRQRNFRINGENYIVEDPNVHSQDNNQAPPLVADIQVLATDKTTNIKVTAFCSVCKRSPCVCVTDFLQGISNPFKVSDNKVQKHLNDKAKSYSSTCSCNTTASSTATSRDSSHTICIHCHRAPCTCCSCKKTHDVKTCSVCQLYSCMCVISPKDSYVGTFIPTKKSSEGSQKKVCSLCKALSCMCSVETKSRKCSTCTTYPCICKKISTKTKKSECKCKSTPCTCSGLSFKSAKTVCSKCGISSCICPLSSRTTSSTTSTVDTDLLRKLFSDCKCGASSSCSCEFVNKLLQHFNKKDVEVYTRALSNECTDVGTQNLVPVDDKRVQDVLLTQEKYVQPKFTKTDCSSQTDTLKSHSKVVSTEGAECINELVQAGIRDESTGTIHSAATTTETVAPLGRTSSLDSRKSSIGSDANRHISIQSDVCSKEKATYSHDLPERVDKSVGKTTDECGTQSIKISRKSFTESDTNKHISIQSDVCSKEKATYSKDPPETVSKSVGKSTEECSTQHERKKGYFAKLTERGVSGSNNNIESVDKDIEARVSQVLKGTDTCTPRETADKGVCHKPSLVDQETDYSPRIVSVEQGTCPRSAESSARVSIDTGTCHSPVVDKEFQTTAKTLVDQGTGDQKASDQCHKSLNAQHTPPMFYETDVGVSTVSEKHRRGATSTGGSKKSRSRSSESKEIGNSGFNTSSGKKSKVPHSEKTTVTSSEAEVGPSLKHQKISDDISTSTNKLKVSSYEQTTIASSEAKVGPSTTHRRLSDKIGTDTVNLKASSGEQTVLTSPDAKVGPNVTLRKTSDDISASTEKLKASSCEQTTFTSSDARVGPVLTQGGDICTSTDKFTSSDAKVGPIRGQSGDICTSTDNLKVSSCEQTIFASSDAQVGPSLRRSDDICTSTDKLQVSSCEQTIFASSDAQVGPTVRRSDDICTSTDKFSSSDAKVGPIRGQSGDMCTSTDNLKVSSCEQAIFASSDAQVGPSLRRSDDICTSTDKLQVSSCEQTIFASSDAQVGPSLRRSDDICTSTDKLQVSSCEQTIFASSDAQVGPSLRRSDDICTSTDKLQVSSCEQTISISSEAKVGPSLRHSDDICTSTDKLKVSSREQTTRVKSKKRREIDIDSLKKNLNSRGIQTELLSNDIRSIDSFACICPSQSSIEKSPCYCCGDKRKKKSKHMLICAPSEDSHKSRKVKTYYIKEASLKKSGRRRCYSSCAERVCCRTRSKSVLKESCCSCHCESKKPRCCCQNEKLNNCTEACSAATPQKTPISTDDSPTDSVYTNSSAHSTCCCCGNKVPLEQISLLRSNNKQFSVCEVCLKKRPILTTICFANPEDTTTESSTPSKTVTDHFRRAENYCTCKKSVKTKNFEYCQHCRQQLKKTQKNRNGIAYTLTLEDETPEKFKSRSKKKIKKLEEIKIKVPNPFNRKQHKNRENNYRKDEDKMKRLESAEDSENIDIMNNGNYSSDEVCKTMNNGKENKQCYSLQEYLQKNRPHFVDAAEYRRLALINNKIERELNKDDQKLKFLEENANNNRLKRQKLFTEQEMREITKRNYKKLPEVQQKLTNQRKEKLRSADRFMADTLNRKIQNFVLKGKRSFPIDTNVVNVL
uniref:Uncharacterized protein LOC114326479 isoform X2 n=1 Tax=Diabrotica virgifera virgifera TaxID=50390 RepID=A0A6P7F4Q4_DIAVI